MQTEGMQRGNALCFCTLVLQGVGAVAAVLSGLQQQLQVAGMPQAAAAAAAGQAQQLSVESLVMLLQEDLRRELRQQTCQALCGRGTLGAGADVDAMLLQQEQRFVLQCWPLVVGLVQRVVEGAAF